MDIAILIFNLIMGAVKLAPEIVELIEKFKTGEEITLEEIERVEALVNGAVDRWDKSGQGPT